MQRNLVNTKSERRWLIASRSVGAIRSAISNRKFGVNEAVVWLNPHVFMGLPGWVHDRERATFYTQEDAVAHVLLLEDSWFGLSIIEVVDA